MCKLSQINGKNCVFDHFMTDFGEKLPLSVKNTPANDAANQ